jgi:hypothetical protein
MSGLRRQLARVTRLEQRRQTRSVSRIVFVSPGEWPPEDAAAYWAAEAAGDQPTMDALIEQYIGLRLGEAGVKRLLILVREVPSPSR